VVCGVCGVWCVSKYIYSKTVRTATTTTTTTTNRSKFVSNPK
jgi:hypothetical protein